MPIRKLCAARGCEELALDGSAHCEEHAAERRSREAARKAEVKLRPIAREGAALYHSRWWRTARIAFLRRYPLCAACAEDGIMTAATEVDHVVPHRGDRQLFRNPGNWQPLCRSCHSRKTAAEVLIGREPTRR